MSNDTTTAPDPNSLLRGGGKSFTFPEVGTKIAGEIVSLETTQQTEFGTGVPKCWPDGKPMWQLVVGLQTAERDPESPDDDGIRRLFLKGGKGASGLNAVSAALREAGVKELQEGGTLGMERIADGTPPQPGYNAPKQYRAQYKAPTGGVNPADLV